MSDRPRSRSDDLAGSVSHTGELQVGDPQTHAASALGRRDAFGGSIRSWAAARFTLAIAVGLAVGGVTEWSVPHLPFSLEPLGNSAAPWVLVALVVALTARRNAESVILAVVTLLALVVGFYVVEADRGWAVSRHQVALWSVASFVIGPVVGLAARWIRNTASTTAALGAGVLGGVLAGEAVYGLTELRFSSPADYWHVQLVLALGLAVGLSLWRSQRRLHGHLVAVAVSLAACAVAGLVTLAAYQTL